MLRPNCSTVGHVTALIKMLRPSLVTRDTRFTLKEVVSLFLQKSYFSVFFLICLKTLHYDTSVETPEYSPVYLVTALIKILRPS